MIFDQCKRNTIYTTETSLGCAELSVTPFPQVSVVSLPIPGKVTLVVSQGSHLGKCFNIQVIIGAFYFCSMQSVIQQSCNFTIGKLDLKLTVSCIRNCKKLKCI